MRIPFFYIFAVPT